MDQLLEELLERKVRLISYEVIVDDNSLSGRSNINKSMLEVINEKTGLTDRELLEMFKPVENAMYYCVNKLADRVNGGKK